MSPRRGRRGERGVTAILVAIVMTVLVGMLGLTINAGHLLATRGENQNAVDSAALAGAFQLNAAPSGLTAAPAAATSFAWEHVTDSSAGEQVVASTIQLGRWHVATRYFEVIAGRDAAAAQDINAVRVASSAPQEVWFGSFLGAGTTSQVGAEAIAVGGSPSDLYKCDLPYVLRNGCVRAKCPSSEPVFYYVTLTSSTVDTAGTTVMLPTAAVSSNLMCQLLQDDDYCKNNPSHVGDRVETANGNNGVTANCGSDGDGETSDDGKICDIVSKMVNDLEQHKVPIVQYDGEPETQCAGNYVADAEIVSYASVKVVYAQCAKNQPQDAQKDSSLTAQQIQTMTDTCYPATNPQGGSSNPQACIVLQLLCDVRDDESHSPGGNWSGTFVKPRLTR